MTDERDDVITRRLVRERGIGERKTHQHQCGHYDACYRSDFAEIECTNCRVDRFNRSVVH